MYLGSTRIDRLYAGSNAVQMVYIGSDLVFEARLLDGLSATPVAAYAMWLLRSTYAGACLRVRRSVDNAEQDIGFVDRVLDIATLLDFAGSGDAFVPKVYSQGTTAGRDLVQATATRQPKIVSAGALTITSSNGTPGMLFDGVDDFLRAIFTLAQPITRIMAARQITWTANDTLWDGNSGNTCRLYMAGASPNLAVYASGGFGGITEMSVGADHVVTEQFNGAASKIAIDNNAYHAGTTGSPAAVGGLTIGSFGDGSQASNVAFYGGLIGDSIWNDADIALCRTNFGKNIGMSL